MSRVPGTPFEFMFEDREYCTNGCLLQGDIIRIIKGESDFFEWMEDALGYLVASNSCDLERTGSDKLEYISLVPVYDYKATLIDFLPEKISEIRKRWEKSQSKGEKYNSKADLESTIANIIFKESNYDPKYTFFISPLEDFNALPSIAFLHEIQSIDSSLRDILLKHRIRSMKAPWREKLGYKVGNLFNRVATFTPSTKEIMAWWVTAYNEEYSDALSKIQD